MNPYVIVATLAALFVAALILRSWRRHRKKDRVVELVNEFDTTSAALRAWAEKQVASAGPLAVGIDKESRDCFQRLGELAKQIEKLSVEVDEYDWSLQARIEVSAVFPFYPVFALPEICDDEPMLVRRHQMGDLLSKAIERVFQSARGEPAT